MALVPQKQWALFSHWLIWHGRRRCAARGRIASIAKSKNFARESGVRT